MNNVQLLGNLTRDPEVKYLTSGTAVGEFSIALNEKWKDKSSGQMKEKVHYVECKAWGATAENIAKYFAKGRKILVEGKLNYESWEDKESGKKRSKLTVTVGRFYFLPDGKGRDSNQDARQSMSGEDNQEPQWADSGDGNSVPF